MDYARTSCGVDNLSHFPVRMRTCRQTDRQTDRQTNPHTKSQMPGVTHGRPVFGGRCRHAILTSIIQHSPQP